MSDRKIKQGNKSVYIEKGENITINYNGVEIPQALTDPPFRHEHFIGRKKELSEIYAALRSDDRPLLLVNGQGGVGKTTLATHYFREHAHEYAHTAWVTCEGNIADDLISRLQDTLGIRDQLRNIIDRPQRTQILLRALGSLQKTCLLVLDNANDPADLQAHYQVLRSCPNFHILLTTRINEFRQAPIYRIEGLPIADALRLFRQYYPALTDTETQTVRQIHQAVGANTLVIELLAKNLHQLNRLRTHYTLADLLQDLREKGLLQLQSKNVHTDYGSLQHAKPEDIITAMYDMNPLDPPQRRLLSIFSVLPSENILFETLEMLLSEFVHPNRTYSGFDDLDTAILNLYRKGWIDFNDKDKMFKISPVVQGIIRHKQQDQLYGDCETLIRNLIEKLKYEGGTGHPINATYEEAAIYARYGENVIKESGEVAFNLTRLCLRIGSYYKTIGSLSQALVFYQNYSKLCDQLCGKFPNEGSYKNSLALSFENLGDTYKDFGNITVSLEYFEKYNELMKQLYNDYPNESLYQSNYAISYEKLGSTHSSLGNLKKALEFFEQYNELEKQLYESHPKNVSFKNNLAISYEKLGETHSSLGNLEKALEFFELQTNLFKQLYESYPSNVSFKNGLAISYSKLGETHSSLGNLEKALEFFEQFNELEKQLYASYPSNVSFKNGLTISYQYLGNTHSSLGNLEKTLQFYELQTNLFKQLYASYPSNVSFKNGLAISYSKLGETHSSLGNLEKALQFYELQTNLFKQLYASYPSNVSFKNGLAVSYSKLGETHSSLGNLKKALQFYEQFNELGKQLYESYPSNVSFKNGLAISYSKLGDTHSSLGNLDKALQFFEQYNELEKQLYASYPSNVSFKNGLALSYQWLGYFFENKYNEKEKAKTYYISSEKLLAELVDSFPNYVEFQKNLNWVRNKLDL